MYIDGWDEKTTQITTISKKYYYSTKVDIKQPLLNAPFFFAAIIIVIIFIRLQSPKLQIGH